MLNTLFNQHANLFFRDLFRPVSRNEEVREDRKEGAIATLLGFADNETKRAWAEIAYQDWWWNQQPKEVQTLRNIPDVEERRNLAIQLAKEGFSIDAAIAVYGYSAYKINKLRNQQGYTWVPAVGMNPVLVAPGLNIPGIPPYDPLNPPTGAVIVDPNPDANADPRNYLRKFDLNQLIAILAVNYGVHV